MKGGQEKVADIYTNKCINIKKLTNMNTYYDKDSVAALNRSLGINLEEIINDQQLNDDQKFNAIYGKILTALLNKWIKNDTTGELGLPKDFNVAEFVKQQVAGASVTDVDYISNISILPEYAQKLKDARDSDVKTEVDNMFKMAHMVINSHSFNVDAIANIILDCGVLALSLAGTLVAYEIMIGTLIAEPFSAVVTAGAVAGLAVMGFTSVAAFFTLLSAISINRSFYGIVLNDTDKDLFIPGWNCIQGNDKMEGIYSRHGKVSGLMVDGYAGEHNAIVGKRTVIENNKLCCCGLYQMDKNTLSATGSESLMRFDWDNTKFDLYSSCPMHGSNALDISFDYVGKKMYEATTKIVNEWKKDKLTYHQKSKNGLNVSSSLNETSNPPAYGVVCVW